MPVERTRSFRPKKWLKPLPALSDGVVASSTTETPLPPVAETDSTPLVKLAEPAAPRPFAEFSTLRKVAGEAKLVVVAPPSRLMVWASKSTSTRRCTTPLALVTTMLVLPVKLAKASVASRPVLRPVRLAGAGTAVEALDARLISSAAWAVNSPSWAAMAGSSVLRSSSRPLRSPVVMFSRTGWPEPSGRLAVM